MADHEPIELLGRFFSFWGATVMRALRLGVNYWLGTLLAGFVFAAALYFTLPLLATRVGWSEAIHETNYILHGVYAIGASFIVMFVFFMIVAPASMYWEQADRIDALAPDANQEFLFNVLRWVSDSAARIPDNDPISIIVLKDHAVALICDAFGRSIGDTLCRGLKSQDACSIDVDETRENLTRMLRGKLIGIADEVADSSSIRTIQPSFVRSNWADIKTRYKKAVLRELLDKGEQIASTYTIRGTERLLDKKRDEILWWKEIVSLYIQSAEPLHARKIKLALAENDPAHLEAIDEMRDAIARVVVDVKATLESEP